MSFRFDGLDVCVGATTTQLTASGPTPVTKYIITSERKDLSPVTFTVAWELAPDDAKVMNVLHGAIGRAMRAAIAIEPRWGDVYCGG